MQSEVILENVGPDQGPRLFRTKMDNSAYSQNCHTDVFEILREFTRYYV